MEISREKRRIALSAGISACLLAGCISDPEAVSPLAPAACPEGLALRVESIGLSYIVVRVDSCADNAVHYILEREIEGDSSREEFVTDGNTGWIRSAKYPIYPGSTSHYRITAYFRDSSRLESNLLTLLYPDSGRDFAPIAVGRSYEYAIAHHASSGIVTLPTGSSVTDSGTFAIKVLSRADSSGISIFQVEYRDSIVTSIRNRSAAGITLTADTLRSRDSTRCLDDGDTVRCEPFAGSLQQARFPWSATHVIGKPSIGLVMPAGGAATTCAHASSAPLPYDAGPQTIYLPGVGIVRAYSHSGTPHSGGSGEMTDIRLIRMDGQVVDFQAYADICSKDFPPLPAP